MAECGQMVRREVGKSGSREVGKTRSAAPDVPVMPVNEEARPGPGFFAQRWAWYQAPTLSATSRYSAIWSKFM